LPVLIHITSLERAISIIRSGVFWAHGGGDAGLNAFVDGQPVNGANEFAANGAVLKLHWSGQVLENHEFPLQPNVLHTHLPWRAVVPTGTTCHLTAFALEAEQEQWISLAGKSPFYCLTKKMKEGFVANKVERLKQNVNKLLLDRPAIKVR
jgi:hypothetical protein